MGKHSNRMMSSSILCAPAYACAVLTLNAASSGGGDPLLVYHRGQEDCKVMLFRCMPAARWRSTHIIINVFFRSPAWLGDNYWHIKMTMKSIDIAIWLLLCDKDVIVWPIFSFIAAGIDLFGNKSYLENISVNVKLKLMVEYYLFGSLTNILAEYAEINNTAKMWMYSSVVTHFAFSHRISIKRVGWK